MSFKRQMVKHIVMHPYHGTLTNKKDKLLVVDTCNNKLDEFAKNNAEYEKIIPRGHMLFGSI